MAHFKAKYQKKADDGSSVTLYKDPTGAWFVGRPDTPAYAPIPMGAFISLPAARRWADRHFPGGSWAVT